MSFSCFLCRLVWPDWFFHFSSWWWQAKQSSTQFFVEILLQKFGLHELESWAQVNGYVCLTFISNDGKFWPYQLQLLRWSRKWSPPGWWLNMLTNYSVYGHNGGLSYIHTGISRCDFNTSNKDLSRVQDQTLLVHKMKLWWAGDSQKHTYIP